MSTNSVEDDCKNSAEDSILQATNNTDLENIDENTNKEKTKTVANAEIVVKIEESLKENLKRNINDRDLMGYHGQNQALPTTWVYFHLAGPAISTNEVFSRFDYTPDRNAFVRLVFTIVFIMVACTAIVNVIVHIIEDFSLFFKYYGLYLALGAMVLMTVLNYVMACHSCGRVMPCNIICLVLAVIGMSIICCFFTVHFETRLILLAVVATAFVVLFCLGLAFTRFDFTRWMLYVVVILATLGLLTMILSLYIMISGRYIKSMHLVILCLGTVLSIVVLIIELQMILGGKTVQLSEDDYVLGAFLLYTSTIDIFLKMVQMMGFADSW